MLSSLRFHSLSLVFLLSVLLSAALPVQARHGTFGQSDSVLASVVQSDSDLVRAVSGRRDVNFVEASQVVVVRLLSDDTQGLPHQRWYVRLSDGSEVFCVYNLDMGGRIPLKVGSSIGLGGQFKFTNQGPLMHWLHSDPQHRRPDGYVEVDGHRYGGQ